MNTLIEEFQNLVLSPSPNYPNFLFKLIEAKKEVEGVERVCLTVIERLALTLRDFPEQRSGLADLSVLARQYIQSLSRHLLLPLQLWEPLSSRAHEFHLWGAILHDRNAAELGAYPWTPSWLPGAEDIHDLKVKRNDYRVIGDGLLLAATGKTTYLSQAQKTAVHLCLNVPPGDTQLVSLPTGAGKSLCIVLPAWQESHGGRKAGGATLVIVPTVALAIDQERRAIELFPHALNERFRPCSLTGGTPGPQRQAIRQGLRDGTLPLLFTSPESVLNTEIYDICIEAAKHGRINRIVIDEAHIVESWGASFRAEFQYLAAFRKNLLAVSPKKPPTLLLSATMSQNCEDLLEKLFGRDGTFHRFHGNRLRPEISYWFSYAASDEEKKNRLLEAIRHLPRPAILYVNKPDEAEDLVSDLRLEGFYRIAAFTGRTETQERERILNEWNLNRRDLIVATSAFGLGVDKPDVRTVIHGALPESIDRYYQEVGRSGRDGVSSIALACVAKGDREKASQIIKTSRITAQKAAQRWDGMRKSAAFQSQTQVQVNLNAKPDYNLDLVESEKHRDWNIHVLLLMQRAGLIEIEDTRIDTNRNNLDGAEPGKGEETEFLIQVNIKSAVAVNNLEELECLLSNLRNKELDDIRSGLDRLTHMIAAYAAGKIEVCVARYLYRLYPDTALACGGCPSCRSIGKDYHYSAEPSVTITRFSRAIPHFTIDRKLSEKLGAHQTINAFWDGAPDLGRFKEKTSFFADLIRMGFGQVFLPDDFYTESEWVANQVRAVEGASEHFHAFFPLRSLSDPQDALIQPLPSVILYPFDSRLAGDVFTGVQKQLRSSSNIPVLNIVHRSLYVDSLAGRFLDRVNGLSEALDRLEQDFTDQLETFDF